MEINPVSKEMKKSVKTRLLTALVLTIISVPCILLGGFFFAFYILIATIIMTYEFVHISTEKKFPLLTYVLIYLMMVSFVFWIFTDAAIDNGIVSIGKGGIFANIGMKDIKVSTLGLSFFVALIFLSVILYANIDIKQACYIITMALVISLSLQSVLFLRYCPEYLYNQVISENPLLDSIHYDNPCSSSLLLLFFAGGALINDAYAFFVGILFGKHKLNPRISPKKTWEGFIGGCILTTITGILFAFIADWCNVPLLKGILDIKHWYFCVLFSLIISIVSVLGDFMFSAIKRYFNVKDFSNILPGHGGLLDRFDSVLITCLIGSVLILFIAYNPLLKLVI